ncbi:MAG: ATP synthase F0 subunit B, partial [Oscillospiraceae bacterium]|nr:ATP synthase F0 subunit B [Oscillospiraceae bacterium]
MDSWLIKLDANLIRTIVIQGATFLAFFMVVKVFFADKIKAMLEERKEAIAKDLSAADAAKANAEKLENEYAEMLKGAHDEKAEILHSATKDGEMMRDKIVAEAREQAETIITNARKEID